MVGRVIWEEMCLGMVFGDDVCGWCMLGRVMLCYDFKRKMDDEISRID